MLMLTTSASRSLKRSNSASYEGNCAEQTLLKAKGTKASTTFFLPRKSLRRQSSRLAVFRVKSGAISPTLRVLLSARGIALHPSYLNSSTYPNVTGTTNQSSCKVDTRVRRVGGKYQ